MRFVDAHHHLWDLTHCNYPWLMARGVKRFFGDPTPIQKNYLPNDFMTESVRWVPDKSVHIQVGVSEADSLKESQWLQSLRDAPDGPGIPNGIVAFIDLSANDAESQIAAQSAVGAVRGVRQIVGRHYEEDQAAGTHSLIENPAWRNGLKALQRSGLGFDLQLIPQQYQAMQNVLGKVEGLAVAICHCGSPWDQSPEGFNHWRSAMREFSRRPETHIKISGMGMFRPDWKLVDIKPWVREAIEIFTPRRVMLGSNFPVDKLYGSYERIWSAYDQLTLEDSEEDRRWLFSKTSESFYRI